MEKVFAKNMIDFIYDSPCSFLAIKNIKKKLLDAGFIDIENKESLDLQKNGKYFITKNDSSIIAFTIGKNPEKGFKIIASHSDSPAFVIKHNPEIKAQNFLKLNTEGYGGMIISSWLDRPLSICGRLALKSSDILKPTCVTLDLKKPVAIIPNLAIHLNRDINSGHKYIKQKELLPLTCIAGKDFKETDFLKNVLAKHLNTAPSDILSYELFLYEFAKGCIIGFDESLVCCPRLDDLMMVYNSTEAFLNCDTSEGINVLLIVDNEEIGSKTAQGAESFFLRDALKRVTYSLFDKKDAFHNMLKNSVAISADMAHGVHPNYPEKHDITNNPKIGAGVCLKYSSSFRYSTDSIAGAIFESLCNKANIKYQKFANNSDMQGGSTIGPIISSYLNIPVIDFGVCMLAMHSIKELAAIKDIYDCYNLFCTFYNI